MSKFPYTFISILIIFICTRVLSYFQLNTQSIHALQSIQSGENRSTGLLSSDIESLKCQANWFMGIIAHKRSEYTIRNSAWMASIQCDPRYIRLAYLLIPDEESIAKYAVQVQPDTAEGWFWLAEMDYAIWRGSEIRDLSEQDQIDAIRYFKEGLQSDPKDGLRWRELGDLLVNDNPQAAIDAYLQSCFNGDPGYNGCRLAGSTAEKLGDIDNAIKYYRYSRWEDVLNRASELEAQYQKQSLP